MFVHFKNTIDKKSLNEIISTVGEMFCASDLNIDSLDANSTVTTALLNIFKSCGVVQVIVKPTWLSKYSESVTNFSYNNELQFDQRS